jgi:hypothetical protein
MGGAMPRNLSYAALLAVPVAMVLLGAGCQGQRRTTAAQIDTRPLEEAKALEIARQSLVTRNLSIGPAPTAIELWNRVKFDVDLRVLGEPIAIEYLTEENRLDIGEIPPPAPGSRLHVLAASAMSEPTGRLEKVYLLVLDSRQYVYQYNPTSQARADVTFVEVSARLQRDLADFLSWYETEKGRKKEP